MCVCVCVLMCVYWHFIGPGQLEWRWAEKVIDVAPEACQKYKNFLKINQWKTGSH